LTLPKGYKQKTSSSGSKPATHGNSHKKALIVIVVIVFIIVNVAVIWNHFNIRAIVDKTTAMLEQDCFPVDAIWNEDKQDYETWPPTSWDCSRDISGDPK
jgi:hypothetical protein